MEDPIGALVFVVFVLRHDDGVHCHRCARHGRADPSRRWNQLWARRGSPLRWRQQWLTTRDETSGTCS